MERSEDQQIVESCREKYFPNEYYPNIQIKEVWREPDTGVLCVRYISAFGRDIGWWHYRSKQNGLIWW